MNEQKFINIQTNKQTKDFDKHLCWAQLAYRFRKAVQSEVTDLDKCC